ncbi:MAG TPA: dicarboxylate/amino acid:cation symporter [Verrucomicrobiae bacterium]|nr:dicarboxylate/amino acid:cation symporter [Verrucomicrobiae bacterium]
MIAGFVAGGAIGVLFGERPILFNVTVAELGTLGMLVIRLLKALAIPLVLFAILSGILKFSISGKQGGKLLLICAVNVSVAMAIGLTIMNTLEPGRFWRERMTQLESRVSQAGSVHKTEASAKATLDPLKNLSGYIPESVVQPLLNNNIISVIFVALLAGFALRRVKEDGGEGAVVSGIHTLENCIGAVYECLVQMLSWIVRLVPFAVMGLVAQAVGRSGLEIFSSLWIFVAVLVGGLVMHGAVYYPLVAWFRAGKSPRKLFSEGADALVMGLSTNSSLATAPTTLDCLTRKMGVSERSARLSACVGTNLNNDGVTLYEAMAALFLAQACGMDLTLGAQFAIVAAAIMAGVGVAGIPEAGLIVLPLVLGAAGLPDWIVAAAIPLILPVDWLVARARSGVNVMSDILVALLLDGNERSGVRPQEIAVSNS